MKMNNKITLAVLIAVNLILWPFFIIPGIIGVIQSGKMNDTTFDNTFQESPSLPEGMPPAGDLLKVRDPFSFLSAPQRDHSVNIREQNDRTVSRTGTSRNTAVETYTSKFRLKSIVQSKNLYLASLEENPHYGNVQNAVAPYSYRFGSQPETPETKSYQVSEGEMIQDEKVVRIRENYVILSRNGKYYKLTFSGGSPVEKP